MGVTADFGNNANLNAQSATFAKSIVVKLICRTYVDEFHQNRLIIPNIDLHIQLIPSQNNFAYKSAAPVENAMQPNFKLVIKSVNFTIHTKQLTSTVLNARMELH